LKNYKWTLIIIGGVIAFSLFLVKFAYQKEVPIFEREAVFSGTISDFVSSEVVENSVVVLKSSVTAVRGKEFELGGLISIQHHESESQNFSNINEGDLIVVKGLYLGYDDLFEEYKLINCILLENE
tara:strand:- start:274 stop:651 length:378 start_codon:yes stop_codon:yes gene_type:complete